MTHRDLSAFGLILGHGGAFDTCNLFCDAGTTLNLSSMISSFVNDNRAMMWGMKRWAKR